MLDLPGSSEEVRRKAAELYVQLLAELKPLQLTRKLGERCEQSGFECQRTNAGRPQAARATWQKGEGSLEAPTALLSRLQKPTPTIGPQGPLTPEGPTTAEVSAQSLGKHTASASIPVETQRREQGREFMDLITAQAAPVQYRPVPLGAAAALPGAPKMGNRSPASVCYPPEVRPPSLEASERYKMMNGQAFNPYVPELVGDREQCAHLLKRFNFLGPLDPVERMNAFAAVVGWAPICSGSGPLSSQTRPRRSIGPGSIVDIPFHCDYGYNVRIGENVIINRDCQFLDACLIEIHDNVVVGPGALFNCMAYSLTPMSDRGRRAMGRDIVIERDVLIGAQATVLSGVRVGQGSIIEAGSVVFRVSFPFPPTPRSG